MSSKELIKMQIKRIEKEMRDTPLHKGTEHHLGRLRAKLSKLKEKELESDSKKGGGGGGYAVKKQGDATVVLVGPPSVGKSTLINKLTNAKSKVAPYAFTTVTVVPGMMDYKDAKIQILDVPGLIEGAEKGKGRGKEVLSVIRGSDLLIIISDVKNKSAHKTMTKTLEQNGIRINQEKPKISIRKMIKGGIQIISNIEQPFSDETVKEISKEYRIPNAEVTIKEKLSLDQLIDSFSKNRVYVQGLYVLNKSDLSNQSNKSNSKTLLISAEEGTNLETLQKLIWKKLGLIRVYLVRPDEKPSKNNPIIMKKGQTLTHLMKTIGEEFAEGKDEAKIWGTGSKFPGQTVSLLKKLQDGMQIRFV